MSAKDSHKTSPRATPRRSRRCRHCTIELALDSPSGRWRIELSDGIPIDERTSILLPAQARLEIIASLNGRTVEAEAALILHRAIMPNRIRAAELAAEDLERLDAELET